MATMVLLVVVVVVIINIIWCILPRKLSGPEISIAANCIRLSSNEFEMVPYLFVHHSQ